LKKTLILISIIFINFAVLANDIEDFVIENVSLGDNLIDHYSIDEIESAEKLKIVYPNKNFYDLQLDVKNFDVWPLLSFSIKKDDKKFKIHSIAGGKLIDIDKCNIEKERIIKDLKSTFLSELKENKYNFTYENITDGKSIAYISHFILTNGSLRVYCTNWSKKTESELGYADNLRLEIGSLEYFDWLNAKAYKE
jgi:hypothetical protein